MNCSIHCRSNDSLTHRNELFLLVLTIVTSRLARRSYVAYRTNLYYNHLFAITGVLQTWRLATKTPAEVSLLQFLYTVLPDNQAASCHRCYDVSAVRWQRRLSERTTCYIKKALSQRNAQQCIHKCLLKTRMTVLYTRCMIT
jgi:hypothetical protein